MSAAPSASESFTLDALQLLCEPGAVHELRALDVPKAATVAGFFDNRDDAANAADRLSGKASSVYLTLNPVNPDLLARANNRVKDFVKQGFSTSDTDVLRRAWLLIDLDPQRVAGISSTEAEHEAALARAEKVRAFLIAEGVPEGAIVRADSGNGAHLLLRVDLPNAADARDLLSRFLIRLGESFDGDGVVVDRTTFNASRICTLYGTMKCKGDSLPNRPHRRARLLEPSPLPTFEQIPNAPRDVLEKIAGASASASAKLPPETGGARSAAAKVKTVQPGPITGKLSDHATYASNADGGSGGGNAGPFDMEGFIAAHGLTTRPRQDDRGGFRWQMDCPFNPAHKAPDAALYVTDQGAAAFKCSHNSCLGNDWYALRDRLEPGWREAKEAKEAREAKTAESTRKGKPSASAAREEAAVNAAAKMVAIAETRFKLWRTPDDSNYATVVIDERPKSLEIESTKFKDFLRCLWMDEEKKPAPPSAIESAVQTIKALASRSKTVRPVYTRKADLGHTIYLDLARDGDDTGKVVEIAATGWRVVEDAPVVFRVPKGSLPLPLPVRGGTVDELRQFVNAPKDAQSEGEDTDDAVSDRLFIHMLAWLLAALGPRCPYPVLSLAGEQGSAKTWAARFLRQLVDPAKPLLRPEPREEREIAIAASNSLVLAWDNLSHLPSWLSDAICRISTGGGFGTRKMYADNEEMLFDFMQPVILTGIGEPSARPDLLERSLLLTLPSIGDRRKTEAELIAAFEEARPRILGALLDIVVVGLRDLKTTRLAKMPRMADFARWVVACESACPWTPGRFLAAYEVNRAEAVTVGLESTAIAPLIEKLLPAATPHWAGTPAQLLEALNGQSTSDRERKGLPVSPRTLSIALRRIEPALRATGVEVGRKMSNGIRIISLRRVAPRDDTEEAGEDDYFGGTQAVTQDSEGSDASLLPAKKRGTLATLAIQTQAKQEANAVPAVTQVSEAVTQTSKTVTQDLSDQPLFTLNSDASDASDDASSSFRFQEIVEERREEKREKEEVAKASSLASLASLPDSDSGFRSSSGGDEDEYETGTL